MSRHWRWGLACLIFLVACVAFSAASADIESPVVSLRHADAAGVFLRVQSPTVTPVLAPGAAPYARLTVPQAPSMARPGAPALPYVITSIAIPAQGEAVAAVTAADCALVPGQWRLQPAPTWSLASTGPDAVQQWLEDGAPWQQTYREDPAIYGAAAPFPPALVELSSPQTMRGRRVVQVRVYPWQTTPLSQQLRFCRTIEVRVLFSQPGVTETAAAPADPDFDALLADQVLNWPVARAWRAVAPPASAVPPPALP